MSRKGGRSQQSCKHVFEAKLRSARLMQVMNPASANQDDASFVD